MALGLRHNLKPESIGLLEKQSKDPFIPASFYFSVNGITFKKNIAQDYKFKKNNRFEWSWFSTNTAHCKDSDLDRIPPGVVVGLTDMNDIKNGTKFFGINAAEGPNYILNRRFKKECGGDEGSFGSHGLCWYERTGENLVNLCDIEALPRGTIIGLKHNKYQADKKLIWGNSVFDPANPNINPPLGFIRREGGDDGAPAGEGYFWYEKITGK